MARKRQAYNFTRRVRKIFTFQNGVDSDTDPFLSAMREGKYRGSLGMRLNVDGKKYSLDKIYGISSKHTTVATDITALGGDIDYYYCVGAEFVDGNHVAFFASYNTPADPSLIAVNGRVVLYSNDFPIGEDIHGTKYVLQIDVNETAHGGEIFINNTQNQPMMFNVQDLIDEWNGGSPTTKYFADFDINNHIVQLSTPLDQPIFMRLEFMSGTSGLPAGGYSYSLRYVDNDGNGTAWGPSTPIIPVVDNYDNSGTVFKGAITYGHTPDPTYNTRYGIRIRFRVTNSGDFAYVEIRRIAHIDGQGLISQPQAEKHVLGTVDIRTNPYTVVDFVDTADKTWEVLDDFTEEELTVIEKTNAIKYYDNRLTVHGPTYVTKVIDDTDLFLKSEEENIAYPYIADLGDLGFHSIWNQVYRKAYMHGERYGWALLCHDGSGGRAFSLPYKDISVSGDGDFTNYQIPNRRDPVNQNTSDFSESLVRCAANNIGKSITVFSDAGGGDVRATVSDSSHLSEGDTVTIYDGSLGNYDGVHVVTNINGTYFDFTDTWGVTETALYAVTSFETHEVMDNSGTVKKTDISNINVVSHNTVTAPYNPFTPTGDKSGTTRKKKYTGLGMNVVNRVRYSGAPSYYTYPTYNPEGWGHKIHSQGMSFEGIDETKLLSHIKSFSIVRTPPAGRVLCQGMGFYSLDEQAVAGVVIEKVLDEFWFYSPDIDQNIGHNPGLFDSIINNPGSYQIQLVSPVGFFSEVYRAYDNAGTGSMIDLISYARILYEDNKFNYGDAAADIGRGDGYVNFGRWRNPVGSTGIESDTTETFIFDITGAEQNTIEGHEGRSVYLKLTVNGPYGSTDPYYRTDVTTAQQNFDNAAMKAWHEPLYICNIINNNVEVPTPNITEYIDTGFHQKLKSIVGYANSEIIQQYKLVDERPADCLWATHMISVGWHTGGNNEAVLTDSNANWITNELVGYRIVNETDNNSTAIITANTANTATGVLAGGLEADWDINDVYHIECSKYVYVNGKAWWALPDAAIFPTPFNNCMVALAATGVWDDGNRNVYGVCVCYQEASTEDYPGETIIEFNQSRLNAIYPATTGYNASFYVPTLDDKVEVWYDNRAPLIVFGGDTFVGDALFVPVDTLDGPGTLDYNFNIGFPYYQYRLGNIEQLIDNTPTLSGINEDAQLNYIHQMACLFTCESRVNLPLMYNDSFPKKNYVIRPIETDETNWGDGATKMYADHYLYKEYENDYGDEYLNWLYGGFHFPGIANIDYSKSLIDRTSYNQPLVGFTERLYYPDRTIWSVLRKNPGELNSLRVFPVLNSFDGSDLSGPIYYAWASNTGKGDNLYKICRRGICILLTDKKLLNDLTGGEIGVIGSSEGFIQVEYWLRRDVGMNDGLWISAAEVGNNLFFANTESVYWLSNNEFKDIGILDYHDKIYNDILSGVPLKGGTAYLNSPRGLINLKNEEYWLSDSSGKIFIFNYRLGIWVGEINYAVDMMCSDKYNVYGIGAGGDTEIFELGVVAGGRNFEAHVIFAANPEPGALFQFKKIEIFSSAKPTSVEFSDSDFAVQVVLDNSTFGSYYLKDKGSYQNKIPRKTVGGARFNAPTLFVKIKHTADAAFTLSTVNITANRLKSQ